MTDLEITKLCAEAMDMQLHPQWHDSLYNKGNVGIITMRGLYDPLHDDAQAMALVKKFRFANIGYNIFAGKWSVHTLSDNESGVKYDGFDTDLNRAICTCVAKMQKDK